jgi:putative transposase
MNKVKIHHPNLSMAAKCRLLSISRGSVYYEARPIPPEDLAMLQEIDQHFMDNPCLGSRKMTALLRRSGYIIIHRKGMTGCVC